MESSRPNHRPVGCRSLLGDPLVLDGLPLSLGLDGEMAKDRFVELIGCRLFG